MASNYVIDESDCVICSDQLKHPKFIGQCNHRFCKECITKYWVSLCEKETIPCPRCGEECQFPPNGADGLRDGSLTAYEFENDLFSLCLPHGRGLQFYCLACEVAVCEGCRLSAHDGSCHHVIQLKAVVDDIVFDIAKTSSEIETIISKNDVEILRLEVQLGNLKFHQIEMKTKLEQGQAATTGKIILDADCVADLTSISQELMDLVRVSNESETKTIIKEVTKSFGMHEGRRSFFTRSKSVGAKKNFRVPQESDTKTIDLKKEDMKSKGEHPGQLRTGLYSDFAKTISRAVSIGRKFKKMKTLKKVRNVTFPTERQCKYVKKIVSLTDGRLSILGDFQGNATFGCDTVYVNAKRSSTINSRPIVKGLDPATDMAVISTGELVVTRVGIPPIRVFNPDTGAYRGINVTHDREEIHSMLSVATDDDDNMFVTTCATGTSCHLLAVNPTGDIIQRIQLPRSSCRMAYSRGNRILHIAAEGKLLRFHWSQNTLKEILSSQQGVEEFYCEDVCIGSRGEVLVAGSKSGNVMIYQVDDRGDRGDLLWRSITFKDNVKRKMLALGPPPVCSKDDTLWLGYGDEVEVFKILLGLY